ncbi:putative nefa-interacting nuclear protein nip30 protein [Botrytis fragariae]|uniref:Putative nefa-interacting nuclear protein nip30 protein n=1 Tax=Botrytis fragariae TaxID=1964551 RepID=A0A8H6AMG2_9HELO|nr:putative nefa-interacting nuclear protein nip30 protein [Botrytis fragariae]KAF5870066.1 putative nefa-interacting nuclear protein nip30 protein [Botrytis fragariae]
MSSGFVSGGTADAPTERSDEWLAAQQEIEANRQRKAIEARQQDGKSLFEILEANKGTHLGGALNKPAAKQDAFEEANKLKNQFRSLDEDEIEFLDSVLESTRAEEDRVRKETAEGLELFRKQQEDADKKARAADNDGAQIQDGSPVREDEWGTTGRKRKRTKDKEVLKGIKVRRASSSTSTKDLPTKPAKDDSDSVATNTKPPTSKDSAKISDPKLAMVAPKPVAVKKPSPPSSNKGLGLVNYGSDEDSD